MTEINSQMRQYISELGSKALHSNEGQKALLSEEGVSLAKIFAYGASLSSVAKGKSEKIQSNVAYMASQALNNLATIRSLKISDEEGVICSMVLQRISENSLNSVPENMNEYQQIVSALQANNFKDPSYVKLAGIYDYDEKLY